MKHQKAKLVLAAVFWLALWQLACMLTDYRMFIASPADTLLCLWRLLPEKSFWSAVLFSVTRIYAGFLLALGLGSLLAVLGEKQKWLRTLLSPLLWTLRAVPVVSFIILVLIFLPSGMVSVIVSFLMGFPMIYDYLCKALEERSRELEELAYVYQIPFGRRVRYLFLPQAAPGFVQTAVLAMGYSWKSGTAAEVLGVTARSVGRNLLQAKTYLDTPALFAWTLVVVILAALSGRLVKFVLEWLCLRLGRIRING